MKHATSGLLIQQDLTRLDSTVFVCTYPTITVQQRPTVSFTQLDSIRADSTRLTQRHRSLQGFYAKQISLPLHHFISVSFGHAVSLQSVKRIQKYYTTGETSFEFFCRAKSIKRNWWRQWWINKTGNKSKNGEHFWHVLFSCLSLDFRYIKMYI